MDRRTLLTGTATAGAVGFGGCLGFGSESERDGVVLTHVELGNQSDEAQTFDVLVTHDDEAVYWSPHEVESGQGEVIDADGSKEHGHVEVHVRVGDVWDRTEFAAEEYQGERVIAVVTYGMVEEEMLRISRRVSDRPTATGE